MKRVAALNELDRLATEGVKMSPETLSFDDAVRIILLFSYMETGSGHLDDFRRNPNYRHETKTRYGYAYGLFGFLNIYRQDAGLKKRRLMGLGYSMDQVRSYALSLSERYGAPYEDVEMALISGILFMTGYGKTVLGYQKLYQTHEAGEGGSLSWYAKAGTKTRKNFDRVGTFMKNHKVMNAWRISLERK